MLNTLNSILFPSKLQEQAVMGSVEGEAQIEDPSENGICVLPRSRSAVVTSGASHHILPEENAGRTEPDRRSSVGPFFIGVTGASASGKTTVCNKIIHGLGDQRCVLVSLDWFYLGLPDGVDPANYNFDHPNAFDYVALRQTLELMKLRKHVSVPKYDFAKHQRVPNNCEELDAADVIIVEGILTFYDKSIRDMLHMKIFVDEDPDICLVRRITRDVENRGRTVESVLTQYTRFVKPSFEEYILPTKRYSDIVVPRGAENLVAIDLIIKHSALKIRQGDMRKLYSNLVVMADSYQARGLLTIIRSRDASREDFVFYSDRLMRLLIEEGLGLLPFERKTVTTPTGGAVLRGGVRGRDRGAEPDPQRRGDGEQSAGGVQDGADRENPDHGRRRDDRGALWAEQEPGGAVLVHPAADPGAAHPAAGAGAEHRGGVRAGGAETARPRGRVQGGEYHDPVAHRVAGEREAHLLAVPEGQTGGLRHRRRN